MLRAALILLTVPVCVLAVVNFDEDPEIISGIPVYNYHLARLARVGQSPRSELALVELMESAGSLKPEEDDDIEWIISLKDGATDKTVDDLCHDKDAHGCLSEGHPDENGISMAGIKSTIGGLTKVLASHKAEISHVEPNLPIFVPPAEAHLDESSEDEGKALLQEAQIAAGQQYYVMRHIADDFVAGEQYSNKEGAMDRFNKLKTQGVPVMLADSALKELAYSGNRSPTITNDFVKWWTQHTGKKPPAHLAPKPTAPPKQEKAAKTVKTAKDLDTRRRRDKTATTNWGLDRIDDQKGLDGSYEAVYDGNGVHVYVLDTGIKLDHTDFTRKDGTSRAETTLEMWGSEVQECTGPRDATCAVDRMGHGTHCAGTVGGETSGVAKGATLHGVKVLGDDGRGSDLGVVMAIDWIMMKGKRPAVLSMSLGRRGTSATMKSTLKKATDSGLTVVVAAGNEDSDACGNSPAFVPEVITVGATTNEDARADFSNYGECLDIFAPGKSIKSAYYAGAARFGTMSGTSMACPHVAGFAALVLQANPQMKPAAVKELMKKEAIKDKMLTTGPRSPDLMLYVDANPSWGQKANPTQGPGKQSGRRRSKRGKSSSRRRKSSRRRRRRSV